MNEEDSEHLPYGLVVRIRGFHPRGPGSIPGMGIPFGIFQYFTASDHLGDKSYIFVQKFVPMCVFSVYLTFYS
uniref:Uncharacterized protein n=1 Tax=Strongyloides venezuelensis TaxID=75913 RepID=A0A0K0G5A0_STRVS